MSVLGHIHISLLLWPIVLIGALLFCAGVMVVLVAPLVLIGEGVQRVLSSKSGSYIVGAAVCLVIAAVALSVGLMVWRVVL